LNEVKQPEYAAKICFCSWLLQNMHNGLVDPQLLFITDEAWVYVSGHVNTQNVNMK
jgi:hypothetical protein